MNNSVKITIKKELRSILRDKKSLLMMLLTPLMIPMFILLFGFVYDGIINKDVDKETKINYGINYELNDIEKEILKEIQLDIKTYKDKDELDKAYKDNEIIGYAIRENNKYTLYANSLNDDGSKATSLFTTYLETYNKAIASEYLASNGIDLDKVYNNIEIANEELKASNNALTDTLMNLGFCFAIMSITLAAIYTSTDTIATEKEHGTLETILTFPIKTKDLIKGKYLAITISCIITAFLSIILCVASMSIASSSFKIFENVELSIDIFKILIGLIIMISYAIFISGLCILVASKTKSYKEAQEALTPVSMLSIVPMMLDIVGIDMTPLLSAIPILSHTLLLKNLFLGNLTSDVIINILVMFASSIVLTIIIIKMITIQYNSEKILFEE